MSELDKWILETAKDIDAQLKEHAANWKETIPTTDDSLTHRKRGIIFETQKIRINLLEAIMGK